MSETNYNWNDSANQEGGGEYAEKLPGGKHRVEITRVVFGKKDGPAFASKGGDPQIMLIFADEIGREANQMVTLSFRAAWVLAKILKAAGANLEGMTSDGVTPASFADPDFATPNLVGRQLDIEVLWSSKNGKEYADITPLEPTEPPAPPQTDDDIPI